MLGTCWDERVQRGRPSVSVLHLSAEVNLPLITAWSLNFQGCDGFQKSSQEMSHTHSHESCVTGIRALLHQQPCHFPQLCSTTVMYHWEKKKKQKKQDTACVLPFKSKFITSQEGTTRWQRQKVELFYLKEAAFQIPPPKKPSHKDTPHWFLLMDRPAPSSRFIPRIETSFRITQWDRCPGHGGKSRAEEKRKWGGMSAEI